MWQPDGGSVIKLWHDYTQFWAGEDDHLAILNSMVRGVIVGVVKLDEVRPLFRDASAEREMLKFLEELELARELLILRPIREDAELWR
jgi:hypothetical protein